MTTKSLQQLTQNQAYRIVFGQLLCVLLIAAVAGVFNGLMSAYSVLAGGGAYVFANLVFVWWVFRFSGAQQMTQFVAAFIAGEMAKLVLSAVLFILIVKYLPVSLLSVLVGFIGAIMSFWFVSLWNFSTKKVSK